MAFIKARIELAWEVAKGFIHGQRAGMVINGVLSQAGFSVLGFRAESETIRCFDGLNILIPIVRSSMCAGKEQHHLLAPYNRTRATNSKGRREEASGAFLGLWRLILRAGACDRIEWAAQMPPRPPGYLGAWDGS